MSVSEKSDHAITDTDIDLEILNLEKKFRDIIAEKDQVLREKNEWRDEEKRLIQTLEEIEEEAQVKAEVVLSEMEKEKKALTEVVEAKRKNNRQLFKDYLELVDKVQHCCLTEQINNVLDEYDELCKEKRYLDELIKAKRSEQSGGCQIERCSEYEKKTVQCDGKGNLDDELIEAKRREQPGGFQIERSSEYEKKIVRWDLISLIIDATSHICKTIFTSEECKVKLKDM